MAASEPAGDDPGTAGRSHARPLLALDPLGDLLPFAMTLGKVVDGASQILFDLRQQQIYGSTDLLDEDVAGPSLGALDVIDLQDLGRAISVYLSSAHELTVSAVAPRVANSERRRCRPPAQLS